MKPGYKTTEFWLTVATNLAAILCAFAGTLPPEKAAVCMAISNGIYAAARGLAKSQQPPTSTP